MYGGNYADRFDMFEQQWAELQALVADGRLGDRDLNAWPQALGGPALMLAGWRGAWVQRAAAESAGWIASGMYADDTQLTEGLARYRDAGGGRAVVTNVRAAEDLGPVIDRMNHLGDIGFDDVVVIDLTASADRMATIAEGTLGAA